MTAGKKALVEIVEQEIKMVNKNRWLSDRDKQLKILELKKLIDTEK